MSSDALSRKRPLHWILQHTGSTARGSSRTFDQLTAWFNSTHGSTGQTSFMRPAPSVIICRCIDRGPVREVGGWSPRVNNVVQSLRASPADKSVRIDNSWRFLADRTVTQYMIGYWHQNVVRPSLRLSVCSSVMLCIAALRVGVQGLKM